MTWYRLACIDMTQPDATTPALIWLEDVSSVGQECRATTYQTIPVPPLKPDGSTASPTWVTEKICIVSLRNGQTFFVRAGEAALLKQALENLELARMGVVRMQKPARQHVRYDSSPRGLVPNTPRSIDPCSLCGRSFTDHRDCGTQILIKNGCEGWFHVLVAGAE